MMPALPELAGSPELVPADAAEAAIAAVRFELQVLADAVERAEAEADELERRTAMAVAPQVDEEGLLARVAAILDQLSLDAAGQRYAAIDSGRREADVRLAAGLLEAARIRGLDEPDDAAGGRHQVQAAALESAGPAPEGGMRSAVVEPVAPGTPEEHADPGSSEAPRSTEAAAPVDLEGIDLTELAELVPILEAMLRGEDVTPPPAAGATAAQSGADAEERFRTFWEATAEPLDERTGWTAMPVVALTVMAALLALLFLVLTLVV